MTQTARPCIAVVGDIMLDVDVHCEMTRVAAEAPIPVCKVGREEMRLGGAGNVARMCKALGADVALAGFWGPETRRLARIEEVTLVGLNHDAGHPTVKTRFIADGRYVGVRVDSDVFESIENDKQAARFLDEIVAFSPDAVIVCDHAKGAVSSTVMRRLGQIDTQLYIDPKPTTFLPASNVACVVGHYDEIPDRGLILPWIMKSGKDGVKWKIGSESGNRPSSCRYLVDPLGAGDQFIATLAVLRCLNTSWTGAIDAASTAAGLQCERMGCTPVTMEEMASRRLS